jgi:hypothetical protein
VNSVTSSPGYDAYINGPDWGERRKAKLRQVGYRCQGCDETERLEVHHLTYDRLGNERMEDLMVLCQLCHALEHGRVPRGTGAVAGPDRAELTRRSRLREDLEERQRLVLLCTSLTTQIKDALPSFESTAVREVLKRCVRALKSIERRMLSGAPPPEPKHPVSSPAP